MKLSQIENIRSILRFCLDSTCWIFAETMYGSDVVMVGHADQSC